MKVLAWILAIAGTIWSGMWFAGSMATERVIAGWLDTQENAGWVVGYDDVATAGYPNRFSTEITEVSLADPLSGWAWAADLFRLEQASYLPHDVTAILPPDQVLATPYERLQIQSDQMEARLKVSPGANFAVERGDLTLSSLAIFSDLGWESRLQDGTLSVERQEGADYRYAVRFDANGFTPAGHISLILDPRRILPDEIDTFFIEALMDFDRAWDMDALEVSRPGITRIDLAELRANWGDLAVRASGDLEVDAEGIPSGDITVRAENWREMVELAVNIGAIPQGLRSTWETGLSLLAAMSGQPDDIETILSFTDGQVYFGPIPIGSAPRFAFR